MSIPISGGLLTAHFGHRDPLETCLAFRRRHGELLGLEPLEGEVTPDVMIAMSSIFGRQHEREVVAGLRAEYGNERVSIGEQHRDPEKHKQSELTLRAMQQGKQIIHSGYLQMSGRSAECAVEVQERFRLPAGVIYWGEPDLLRRVDSPGCGSVFRDYYYEVADIKSARTSKMPARLQVAFYSWLLNDLQNANPKNGFLPSVGYVLPRTKKSDAGSVTTWERFEIDDVLPIAELFVREEYWRIALADPAELISTSGYERPLSRLWATTHQLFGETLADSELSALPNMRVPVRRRLRPHGITAIKQLAELSDGEIQEYSGPGATTSGLEKQRTQAQVCRSKRPRWRESHFSSIQEVINAITSNEDWGDDVDAIQLDDPSIPVVHFDMEGHPFREIEYLFGYQVDLPGQRPRRADSYQPVVQIWAEEPSAREEQRAFESFLGDMESLIAEYGDLVIVHYANYEKTRLNMLADRYPDNSNRRRVDRLSRHLLDLYRVVQRAFYLPFASYSIKDVAPGLEFLPPPGGRGTQHQWLKFATVDELSERLLRDRWAETEVDRAVDQLRGASHDFQVQVETILNASANMSVFWYEQWCQSGERIWRHLIDVYNADDLIATQRLFDYLLRLQRVGLASIDDSPGSATARPLK